MGYYQMKKMPTKAGRKDPRYIQIFDHLRDLEYTVAQARMVAQEACYFMNLHPNWTAKEAIRKVLE